MSLPIHSIPSDDQSLVFHLIFNSIPFIFKIPCVVWEHTQFQFNTDYHLHHHFANNIFVKNPNVNSFQFKVR